MEESLRKICICNKRVSFSKDPHRVYSVEKSNRRGVWEHFALDRVRFDRRISNFNILFKSSVLKNQMRKPLYTEDGIQ